MTTAPSLAPSSPHKKVYKNGYANGDTKWPPESASPWQRGVNHGPTGTRNYYNKRQFSSKKVPKKFKLHYDDHPDHNVLLQRLSSPPSSPFSGTLLERIGGSAEDVDEVASTLTTSDQVDRDENTPEVTGFLPFSTATPHFYTPEPGEVERFLESVIPSTLSESPSGIAHACSTNKPSLVLETHNLLGDHLVEKVEDPSSSSGMLYSPAQTSVNSLPSVTNPSPDPDSLLGGAMSTPSASALEECRRRLVPVLLSSVQARDPGSRPDAEQCMRLLSDDHCHNFFRKAKEMRRQLSSLLSQQAPANHDRHDQGSGSGSALKRDRTDDDQDDSVWGVHGRSRLNSVNTVVSDVSRKGSDITLVDVTAKARSPPKVPRAMLQGSQQSGSLSSARSQARAYQPLAASPTTETPPELVHQAFKLFSAPAPTMDQPAAQVDDISMGPPAADQPERPTQMTRSQSELPATSTSSLADFVTHLPTQPGVWFKRQGRRFAEIVDVEIEVSDDMFYLSKECQPSKLRVHLQLCSVPVGAITATKNETGEEPPLCDVVESAIARRALQWPKKGTLIVQVNQEFEQKKTWLPYVLESDALDVTSSMRPGKNVFRFIQLADLSEFDFVLVASSPSREEQEWRSWDWAAASLTAAATTTTTMGAADEGPASNGLSEFACIPIAIRS